MDAKYSNSQMTSLIALADEILKVLRKIKNQIDKDEKENAENGRYDFAYVKYYLAEVSSLLNLSVYLLKHDTFRKYTYFPARQIMEIVLQLEHVYSVKNMEGLDGVRRIFFKDIAISIKSTLALPGDSGKDKLETHLSLLDIASMILKLDFKTEDISAKSKRGIKFLCGKSSVTIKQHTGAELYSFYEVLSESSHANVVNIGASESANDQIGSLNIFEISIELAIRFCEMVINESTYEQLNADVINLKNIAGIK